MYHVPCKCGLSVCFQEVQNLVGKFTMYTGNGTRACGILVRLWHKPIKESKKVGEIIKGA